MAGTTWRRGRREGRNRQRRIPVDRAGAGPRQHDDLRIVEAVVEDAAEALKCVQSHDERRDVAPGVRTAY